MQFKIQKIILVSLLILLLGCTQQDTQESELTCNTPYIKVANDCCLDRNNNSVCDNHEEIKAPSEKVTIEENKSITDKETGEITNKTEEVNKTAERTEQKVGDCNIPPTTRQFNSESYYTGPLIDTHLHMPVASQAVSKTAIQLGFEDMPYRGDITTDYIACLFESEGIKKGFGFFIHHKLLLSPSVNALKKDMEKHSEKFVVFFMPPFPMEGQTPEVSAVEDILKDNPGLYQGYGEIRFDFTGIENSLPEEEYLLEMYELADGYNLIVQMHPKEGQVDALERLLKKYPNVKFLAHVMPTEKDEVAKLMDKYDNLYYSLDAEINHIYGYQTIQDNQGPTKEKYLEFMKENFDSLVDEAVNEWKPLIEAHPDRYTWGTDRWFTWHYDKEVGAVIEELGRTFIGRLDPAVQEKFAYKNAEELLENR